MGGRKVSVPSDLSRTRGSWAVAGPRSLQRLEGLGILYPDREGTGSVVGPRGKTRTRRKDPITKVEESSGQCLEDKVSVLLRNKPCAENDPKVSFNRQSCQENFGNALFTTNYTSRRVVTHDTPVLTVTLRTDNDVVSLPLPYRVTNSVP